MALPKCPNPSCPSNKSSRKAFFELKEEKIGAKYTYFLVQCSACGTVVGILEFNNTETLFNNQDIFIKKLSQQNDNNNAYIVSELNRQTIAIRLIAEKIGLDNII